MALAVRRAYVGRAPERCKIKPMAEQPKKTERPPLTKAARRALAEAEARRMQAAAHPRPPEVNGRKGPEPVRYGDWEVKGIASDF